MAALHRALESSVCCALAGLMPRRRTPSRTSTPWTFTSSASSSRASRTASRLEPDRSGCDERMVCALSGSAHRHHRCACYNNLAVQEHLSKSGRSLVHGYADLSVLVLVSGDAEDVGG